MKKTVYFLAATLFAGGSIIAGCMRSKEEKVEQAHEEVIEKKEELKEAEANYTVTVMEFKTESNQRISDNEKRIAELKEEITKGKNKMKSELRMRLDKLEEKNKELKKKMDQYEDKGKENWESFKREMKHDLDELGQALKDLTVDNEK